MTANDEDRPTSREWVRGGAIVVVPVVVLVLGIVVLYFGGTIQTGSQGPVGTLMP